MPAAAKSPAKRAKTAAYRRLVVDAAERVFAEQGYEGARMQDLAAEAGLALGTLYSLYDGKADVYRAVHEDRLGELFTDVEGRIDPAAGVPRMLLDGTAELMRWLAAHPLYLRMNLREGYSWASSSQYESDVQVQAWDDGIALMAGLFEAGIADGSVHPGDPQIYARALSALQQIHISKWSEADGALPLESVIAELGTLLSRTFFIRPDLGERP